MDLMDEINGIDNLTLKPTQTFASMKPKPKSGYVAMTVAVAMGRGGFRSRVKQEEKGNSGSTDTVKPELTTTSKLRPPVYNGHCFEVPIRPFIT